jgi:hypothetical protein
LTQCKNDSEEPGINISSRGADRFMALARIVRSPMADENQEYGKVIRHDNEASHNPQLAAASL